MVAAGVVAMVNAPIVPPGGEAYGLLQVDSRKPREFSDQDAQFLRTYTAILGPVVDRLLKVRDLEISLERNERLMVKLRHRIKNNIATIMRIIRIRQMSVKTKEARDELSTVGDRVDTLNLIHRQMYETSSADRIGLRRYLEELGENLLGLHNAEVTNVRLDFDVVDCACRADIASTLGLILNEFATNSLKYAFDADGGVIGVAAVQTTEGGLELRLWDDGKGLPAPPEEAAAETGAGTGMTLINALARQIGAAAQWTSNGGVQLRLTMKSC